MKETRTLQELAFANLDRATNAHETKILLTSTRHDREPHCPDLFQHHVEGCFFRELKVPREFKGCARTKAHVYKRSALIDVSGKLSGALLSWLQPDDRSIIILRSVGTQR